MAEYFSDIYAWIDTLSPFAAYAAILGIAWAENVLPPIPGDLAIAFGGYLVSTGKLEFALVVFVATIGGTLGFMSMYAAGRVVGDAISDPGKMRWIPKRRVARAKVWLSRRGFAVVAANRFLSGLRSVIALSVGMAGMDAGKTALWSLFSSLLWTVLITYLGFLAGENWAVVKVYLERYGLAIGILILLFIVVRAAIYVYNVRSANRELSKNGE